MDLLSCMLWILLAGTLAKVFQTIARGSKRNTGKLPPGPAPFPVIGNLFDLGKKPHESLTQLAKTYGPIMSLKLGSTTTIVMSSSTAAKEVLQKQDLSFANRFIPDAIRAQNHHQASVGWIPVSSKWRDLRRICNSHIFSNQKLDSNKDLRRRKIQQLISDVEQSCKDGVSVNIGQAAFKTSLNLISNTTFSMDLADKNSDTTAEFKEVTAKIMEAVGKPNLVDFFPVLRKIDPQGIRRRVTTLFGKMIELFDCFIENRLKMRKEEGFVMSNDVLDTLLSINEDRNEEFDRTDIDHLLMDLFLAGTETSSSTVEWAMAEILRNPEILLKAKLELEQIIGKGKVIEESDINQLPYLQAIVKETFRLHPPVPLLFPRTVQEDTKLWDYTIPKGARVLVNVWAIGRNPSLWENPSAFVPERFIGSNMDVKGFDFELIPFGAGRRLCPGLPLAMRMIHLMLGSLIHLFHWKVEDDKEIDMDDKFGLTLQKVQPLSVVPILV